MTNQTYNDVVNLSSTILRETLDGLTAVYSGVEQAKLYMFWETEDEAEEPGIKVCDFGYGMRGSWCEGIGHLGGGVDLVGYVEECEGFFIWVFGMMLEV